MRKKPEYTEWAHVRLNKRQKYHLDFLRRLIRGDNSDVLREALRFAFARSLEFDAEQRTITKCEAERKEGAGK